MNKEQDILTDLFKYDVAAREAYNDVIDHIQDEEIRTNVKSFLKDHERHIEKLSSLITKMTGSAPVEEKGLKGSLLKAYADARSITGQEGALKALKTSEEIILKRYQEANRSNLSDEAMQVVKDNLKDEEKVYQYIGRHVS